MLRIITIVNFTDHAFLKKWAVLEKVNVGESKISAGHIQVDLSIVSTNDPPAPVKLNAVDDDFTEE